VRPGLPSLRCVQPRPPTVAEGKQDECGDLESATTVYLLLAENLLSFSASQASNQVFVNGL
jgi:hypothetical protein